MPDYTVHIEGVRFLITTAHPASSYDQPVVVTPNGEPLGSTDLYQLPSRAISGAEIMRRGNPDLPEA